MPQIPPFRPRYEKMKMTTIIGQKLNIIKSLLLLPESQKHLKIELVEWFLLLLIAHINAVDNGYLISGSI